jgi:flavin-dependent dehydrogenase
VTDVVIAGGGPAGALAAIILSRNGVKVRVFERARFPRHKLCGDTLNPGALAVLARHVDTAPLIAVSDPIDGMVISGPGGARIEGRYGRGLKGRAVTRKVLDQWLIEQAVAAGADVNEGATIRSATSDDDTVNGVMVQRRDGGPAIERASLVLAADGRRSQLAFSRGLARQPQRPRRWAIGAYFTDVGEMTTCGEMHVREDHYIGVAPVPHGLVNACLVVPHANGDAAIADPRQLLETKLQADPDLARRFARARLVDTPVMLGPMAIDCDAAGEPGLLMAGDAAGFIDPMTGDGLRLALASAELAAETALDVLAGTRSPRRAHAHLFRERQTAFAAKWRFNRTLRALVASPRGVAAAAKAARLAPSVFQWMVEYAGDCPTIESFA